MKRKRQTAAVGRPRAFDADKALDRALEIFWRKGYEGTAISDLTAAMRINRPSIYAAFGNKEELFRKVLDRYAEGPASAVREALEAPTARQAVERVLLAAADVPTRAEGPRGCLLVQGALACGDASESVRRELISRRVTSRFRASAFGVPRMALGQKMAEVGISFVRSDVQEDRRYGRVID